MENKKYTEYIYCNLYNVFQFIIFFVSSADVVSNLLHFKCQPLIKSINVFNNFGLSNLDFGVLLFLTQTQVDLYFLDPIQSVNMASKKGAEILKAINGYMKQSTGFDSVMKNVNT